MRDVGADRTVLAWILQIIYYFLQFLLGLRHPRHIIEGNLVAVGGGQDPLVSGESRFLLTPTPGLEGEPDHRPEHQGEKEQAALEIVEGVILVHRNRHRSSGNRGGEAGRIHDPGDVMAAIPGADFDLVPGKAQCRHVFFGKLLHKFSIIADRQPVFDRPEKQSQEKTDEDDEKNEEISDDDGHDPSF